MTRRVSMIILAIALAGLMGFGAWTVLLKPSDLPPDGFSRGNGRIEADLIDISPRLAGRIAEIRVREGDRVSKGDVLVVMDTAELRALASVGATVEEILRSIASARIAHAQCAMHERFKLYIGMRLVYVRYLLQREFASQYHTLESVLLQPLHLVG